MTWWGIGELYIPAQPPRNCRVRGSAPVTSRALVVGKLAGWNLSGYAASKPGEVWILGVVLGVWHHIRTHTNSPRSHARTASSIAPPNPMSPRSQQTRCAPSQRKVPEKPVFSHTTAPRHYETASRGGIRALIPPILAAPRRVSDRCRAVAPARLVGTMGKSRDGIVSYDTGWLGRGGKTLLSGG